MRRTSEPRGRAGAAIIDPDGNSVAFYLEIQGQLIASASYKATTCVTLLALCEQAVDLLRGLPLPAAGDLSAEDLLARHPDIPPIRHDHAVLVIRAIRAALAY